MNQYNLIVDDYKVSEPINIINEQIEQLPETDCNWLLDTVINETHRDYNIRLENYDGQTTSIYVIKFLQPKKVDVVMIVSIVLCIIGLIGLVISYLFIDNDKYENLRIYLYDPNLGGVDIREVMEENDTNE